VNSFFLVRYELQDLDDRNRRLSRTFAYSRQIVSQPRIRTLTRYDTIIPGVAFLMSQSAIQAKLRIVRSRFHGW